MNTQIDEIQEVPNDAEIPGLERVARDLIRPHIYANTDREVGGVLVGEAPSSGVRPTVSGAIKAVGAIEKSASLTFTQDSWEHIHGVLSDDHPEGTRITGWYHSHPGIGVYLSEQDLFIHHNFFALPAQIALVIDPVARNEGLFVWDDGAVVKLWERPTPVSGTDGS